jgi:hypothetical protein
VRTPPKCGCNKAMAEAPVNIEFADYSNEPDGVDRYIEPPREPVVGDSIACRVLNHHARRFSGPLTISRVERKEGRLIIAARNDSMDENEAVVLDGGYGEWYTQWVFADEPFVEYFSDLERQLVSMRCAQRRRHGDWPTYYRMPYTPPCSVCGVWPCKEQGGCPDFYKLAFGYTKAQLIEQQRGRVSK